MQQNNQDSSASVIDGLIQSAGQPDDRPFRERARRVGAVYTISYSSAIVAVYDYDREQAGGHPRTPFYWRRSPKATNRSFCFEFRKRHGFPQLLLTTRRDKRALRIRAIKDHGQIDFQIG